MRRRQRQAATGMAVWLVSAATKALRRNVLALAGANATAGAALIVNAPGLSPSLLFLAKAAPLPAWGMCCLAVAVLLLTRQHLIGHTVAVPIWLMWGIGAVLGLLGGSTTSPTGSIALTGMVAAVAGMHIGGLAYRRDERWARKQTGVREDDA